jgi:hypothetical protein
MNEQHTVYFNQITSAIIESDLGDFEKLLAGEIYTMANTYGSIFPTNKFLAKRYRKSNRTISSTLNALKDKGYIKLSYEYSDKGEVEKRTITPIEEMFLGYGRNLLGVQKKTSRGIEENFQENISINKSINRSINKDIGQTSLTDRFEALWKMYPRKSGKKQSFEIYKRAIKKGATDDEIKQGIENYLKQIKIKGTPAQYIKQGSTWFRNEGWDDEYDFTTERPTHGKQPRVIEHRPNEWDNTPNDDDIVPDFEI